MLTCLALKTDFWRVKSQGSFGLGLWLDLQWNYGRVSSVQFSSVTQSCPTFCYPMDRSTPVLPVHHQPQKFTQTHVHWAGDAIQPSHPLLSPSPPAFTLSQHQGLFIESALRIRWPKYWSFSFNISPSNEYSGLISFRMDWLDLLAVQGTLKSLLQHHSSKASVLQCSAFFIIQLSHPYMTTGTTIALTRQTFVGKVMSLLGSCQSKFSKGKSRMSKCNTWTSGYYLSIEEEFMTICGTGIWRNLSIHSIDIYLAHIVCEVLCWTLSFWNLWGNGVNRFFSKEMHIQIYI